MATLAARAAKDRESNERIADKDRKSRENIADKDRPWKAVSAIGSMLKGTTKMAMPFTNMGNHPDWYKKFIDVNTVANLPTFDRLGVPPAFAIHDGALNNIAGVVSFHYIPTLPNLGKVGDSPYLSPINVGLSRFMAELRKMNSRIGQYDASDFGLYWYSAADYMTIIEKLRQAIAIYSTYHAENAYFADAMLEAIGFSSAMVVNNIAQLKELCAKHIAIFNSSIAVPKNLTFFARRLWMARALIKDRRNIKSQYYVFCPDGIGTLSEDEDQVIYGASSANKLRVSTFSAFELLLEQRRAALVDAQGIITMVADLRAGIPASEFFTLDAFDESYRAEPTDDGYDLEQIHNIRTCLVQPFNNNASVAPSGGIWTNMNIRTTNDGYLIQGSTNTNSAIRPTFTPVTTSGAANICAYLETVLSNTDDFINIYHDDVTNDDILEASRLRHLATYTTGSGEQHPFVNGTEVIGYGLIYYYDSARVLRVYSWGTSLARYDHDAVDHVLQFWSNFDWMPPTRIFETEDDGSLFGTLCEFDQYFCISPTNLAKLHEAAGLSEFYIDAKEFKRSLGN